MKCAHDICEHTFSYQYWGSTFSGDQGWFHQNYLEHWCPDHIPEWLSDWVGKIKPYRPTIDVPNDERREHLSPLFKGE